MNDFEKRIMAEYIRNHALSLSRESAERAMEFADIADFAQVRDQEMSVATMYRVVYLAVKEYHDALSQHLSAHGIVLPDFDTLVSDIAPQKE